MVYLPLTYVPTIDSLHVYLNGVEQFEPTDWTLDAYSRIKTLAPMEALTGDLLECRYAHLFETPDVVPLPPYVDAVMSMSPYAYWRLNEASGTTAADFSGNGRDATLVSTVDYSPNDVGGLGGGSGLPGRPLGNEKSAIFNDETAGHFDFLGNNHYLQTNPFLLPAFTLVYFSYHVGGAGQRQAFIMGSTTMAWQGWLGSGGNGNFIAYKSDGTTQNLTLTPYALATFNDSFGKLLAISVDTATGNWAVHQDGALTSSGSVGAFTMRTPVGQWRFGSNGGNSSGHGLSEVAYFDRVLSDAEHAALYSAAQVDGYWW